MMSGRVSTSMSLLPRSSFGCDLKRSPRKSSSVSLWRWIIVPIAPSRTRIRSARRCSSRVLMFEIIFNSACDQYRKRISRRSRTDAHLDVGETGADEKPLEIIVCESQPAIADPVAYPFLIVFAQIEGQHAAAGLQDARRFGDRARRIRGMVQRLREQRDIDRRVIDRQLFHVAPLPRDVLHPTAFSQRLRALEHVGRSIDADDAIGPLGGFN